MDLYGLKLFEALEKLDNKEISAEELTSSCLKRIREVDPSVRALVSVCTEMALERARMIDELPQSADGKTIMTTEPKFIPNEAVSVKFDKMNAAVRLIDCVGFVVEGALGQSEGDKPRMVKTPWKDAEIPFEKAAEIGT